MPETVNQYNQLLFDIFTTALEGGIGYWSQASAYHWHLSDDSGPEGTVPLPYRSDEDITGFYAVVREYDEDTDLRIDRDVIVRGYRLATSSEWRDKVAWSSSEKPPLVVTAEIPADWDYDAGDADVIVQLGLFGEVVYG